MNDIARCLGHGAGPSGHQNRMDCANCLRRVAPRAGALPWMTPPEEFPCPSRIPYDERTPMLVQLRKAVHA